MEIEAHDEDELVQRSQAGGELAFRRFVEIYSALAWRTAHVFLPDGATEDTVQEAWLDAWRGLPGLQRSQPFGRWLLTLVANRCRITISYRGSANWLTSCSYYSWRLTLTAIRRNSRLPTSTKKIPHIVLMLPVKWRIGLGAVVTNITVVAVTSSTSHHRRKERQECGW